jgi:sulfite exporter TauE/SafE
MTHIGRLVEGQEGRGADRNRWVVHLAPGLQRGVSEVRVLIGGALVAGLVGSPHCLAMCGGFSTACGDHPVRHAAWHAGRLSTYAVLGALAGAFGSSVPGPGWLVQIISGVLLVFFALALAGVLPEPRMPIPGLAKVGAALAGRVDLPSRYAFGLVNGLLPCGLVYAALAVPIAAADPLVGAGAMVAFGLGTIPALAAFTFGLRRAVQSRMWTRRALALAVLAAGLWSLGHRLPAEAGEPPACHEPSGEAPQVSADPVRAR